MNGMNPGGAGVRAGRGADRHSTASARRPRAGRRDSELGPDAGGRLRRRAGRRRVAGRQAVSMTKEAPRYRRLLSTPGEEGGSVICVHYAQTPAPVPI